MPDTRPQETSLRFTLQAGAGESADLSTLHAAALACSEAEGIPLPCLFHLTLTDDPGIRELNRIHRNRNRSTDVLSFPSLAYPRGRTAAAAADALRREWDPVEKACFLGDVVISLDTAKRQAQQLGHSESLELVRLLVHGVFHLFGHDHIVPEEKKRMQEMENRVLSALSKDMDTESQTLVALAREAMNNAYVPYSRFRVGACLLSEDGRRFTGCNVENASYGLTNCAERTALFKAVSEGARSFTAIAVAAESTPPWPCGACRQVLSEFSPGMRVIVAWGKEEMQSTTLSNLLPHHFSSADLSSGTPGEGKP